MLKTRSRLLAWGFTTLVVANIILILVLAIGNPSLSSLSELVVLRIAAPLVFSIVAALIISKQPGNRIGWLMMLFAWAVTNPISSYVHGILHPPLTLTLGIWILIWLDAWSWVPIFFSILLIPLHFPTGRPPSPRWKWVNRLAVGMWLVFIALAAFNDTFYLPDKSWSRANPIGFIPEDKFWQAFEPFWGIGLLTIALTSIASLFVRYRRSKGVERQQIKWLLYGGALFAVNYAISLFFDTGQGWQGLLLSLSIFAIPIAMAIAILRHQLYDIDIIIRRTVTYAVLTASLGLIYFGMVVLLQTALGRATDEQSPLIIVISTLLIAALFSPLRRRIQSFIDRRFYRRKYDAAQILAQFAVAARDEVDFERLSETILTIVEKTMQPKQTTLWFKKSERKG